VFNWGGGGVPAPDSVVSYASAALMYGLSVWNVPLNRVHVTRNRRRSGGRKDPRVHLHAAPLGSADVVEIDGLLVTSVALTLLDIARTVPMEQAVVVADQALARHLVTAEELGDAIAERRRWPGMPAARAAHWSSPPRAAGASASRAAGWPLPAPGCRCRSCSGRSPTRQAGSWAKWTSAGPLCARSASSTAVSSTAPSRTRPRRFIRRSCARTLRGEDLGVVRWGWDALTDYRDTAARLRRQYRPI